MSPTYFVIQQAKLNAELETAGAAGDFLSMQTVLAGLTALNHAMYGRNPD